MLLRYFIATDEPYPRWMTRALDGIVAKADDAPLSNAEVEALLRYHHGDEWFKDESGEVLP